MKCSMCENPKELKKSRITVKYKECGLDNVVLAGVEHYRCQQCGEEYFGYGDMDQLHHLIAHVLLKKRTLLTGKEIRFLRKHLGYSGTMFGKLIGYEHETISRIETGSQSVTEAFDRLVRFLVASKFPDRNYDLHDQILKGKGTKFTRIELKFTQGGIWETKLAA